MVESLLKQVQYLKENGFTEQQANAIVYFHKDSIENKMATKKDILILKKDMAIMEKNITLRLGSLVVGGVVILGTLMTIFNL